MTEENLRKDIGMLMKNLNSLHTRESQSLLNLHEDIFFQKLISRELLEIGVRVKPADYFMALTFLNYFTGIVEDDYKVCNNLISISKALRKEEKERKEDKGASYLNLDTVILETALYAQERATKGKEFYPDKKLEEIRKRYQAEAPLDLQSEKARKAELFYCGIGKMVCSLLGEKTGAYLPDVRRRTDLEALVFTSSILKFLTEEESKEIYESLSRKDYLEASLTSLKKIARKASIEQLKSAVEKNEKED